MIFNRLNLQNNEAALITSLHSALYLTGYHNPDCCIFITEDKSYYITDSRYINEARTYLSREYEIIDAGKQHERSIQNLVNSYKIKKLGLELDSILYSKYTTLKEIIDVIFFDISTCLTQLRLLKSSEEVKLIERAVKITDTAFDSILPLIREDISELELACKLELQLIKAGGEGLAFDIICVFGENTSNPHGRPSHRKLKKGDAITLDFGAKYKGYCADLTRSLFFGDPSNEYIKVYNIVKDANTAIIDALYTGMPASEADNIGRSIIADNGYSDYFRHSVGHGVGIEVHEKPYLAQVSTDILDNNMVFSVEPGIYLKDFGVRIEDLVLLDNNTVTVLSSSPKDLIIL